MIKVLIVEDSQVVREFLVHVLSSDPEIQVIATARDGEEALEAVARWKPDVITMDIHMPRRNGLEATREIMETHPTPIVIVSGSQNLKEVKTTFQAMEAGALAVLPRPKGLEASDYEASVKELIQTVKLMSEVKVVKRWPRKKGEAKEAPQEPREKIAVAAIGASTGGPVVLQTILSGLPREISFPLLVAQHIAPDFVTGFAEWLGRTSSFPVEIARDGQSLSPGRAYVPPGGYDLGAAPGNRLHLRKAPSTHGPHPSISYLFQSVCEVYGSGAAGVLLTGMGNDGARELKVLKEIGGITIAQDERSCTIYGMPAEAVKLGAAMYVLSPEMISRTLQALARGRAGESPLPDWRLQS